MIIRPYPGFIIPERRYVDVGMPTSRVTAKGRYMLRVIDSATGGTVRQTPWFDNIILDAGLNRWGTGPIILGAAIGTGTSTPAATDTGLQTESLFTTQAGTGAGIVAGVSPNYNNTRTFVYRTALGALDGNYTEVGVGWETGAMFSRALILDLDSNPTSIAVNTSQQVDIFYQLSIYPPLTDWTDTVSITGSGSTAVTGRAARVTTTTGSDAWGVQAGIAVGPNTTNLTNFAVHPNAIGDITAFPSGTSSGPANAGAIVTAAYSNNSLNRTVEVTFALTAGNVTGGVLSARVTWSLGGFQYQFDPVIPKDGTKSMVLNYSLTWARR